MDLRTTFKIETAEDKITYNDKVMFIGSCFASSVGSKFAEGKFPVMINPTGTVFNPVSVSKTLDTILSEKQTTIDDLFSFDGYYISFNHYTDFSSEKPELLLEKINKTSVEALDFLSNTKFLFITFGTARVYKRKDNGEIVSNCHKIPSDRFNSELLTVSEIVDLWKKQLDRLHTLFPDLKVIFTVSPVRHLKDSAHGNQISKAVLLLAVEELLKHKIAPHYFPAYEILMDDLRDYRYYSDDMIHPSSTAIEYIWKLFSESFIESNSLKIWKEAANITKAVNHRIHSEPGTKVKKFADQIIRQISDLEIKAPGINLSGERRYFNDLLSL
jgi:hypothetical protein